MRREYWLVPLLAILAMAVNIAVSFGVVFVYSVFVAPGQDMAAYEAFALQSAPLSSVIAGVPILFAAGWLAARNSAANGLGVGLAVGIVYVLIDGALVVAAGALAEMWVWELVSYSTKLAAAAAGGHLGARRA